MSWFGKIFGATAAEPIEAIGGALDKLFTSDDERLTRQEAIERLRMQPALAQAAITQAEAGHRSVFVAGWRPAIGWVAAASLAAYYLPQYVLASFLWGRQVIAEGQLIAYPVSADGLLELVLALVGLAGLRTAEKFGKVAR